MVGTRLNRWITVRLINRHLLFAWCCFWVIQTDELLQRLELLLYLLELLLLLASELVLSCELLLELSDLRLLLADRVNEYDVQPIVLDAFNLTLLIMCNQQWLDGGDLFSDQTEVGQAVRSPFEADWSQVAHQLESGAERMHLHFVTQT